MDYANICFLIRGECTSSCHLNLNFIVLCDYGFLYPDLQLEQGQLAVVAASDSSDRSKDKTLDQKVTIFCILQSIVTFCITQKVQ